MAAAHIPIKPGLTIPRREIRLEFFHAPGPGGQNVNKTATAVALCFHPDSSSVLTPIQKDLVKARLVNRINADGVLRLASTSARSQAANRFLVEIRFRKMLASALEPVRKRRPTLPTGVSRERRLEGKRLLAARKENRRRWRGAD